MKDFWNGLHPVLRNVLVAAAALGVGFAGWKAYQYFTNTGERKDLKGENKDVKAALKDLQQEGQKATYTDSQYSTWANQLKEAFDGCGTSNNTWKSVFKQLKNDVDVLKLQEAYGTRKFDECNWEGNFGDFEGTLPQAIVHELSGSEQNELNKSLETAKITTRY